MKKLIILMVIFAMAMAAGCNKKTAEQKVEDQLTQVYPLNTEERQLAQTNAKQFYEKEWPVQKKEADGNTAITKERGFYLECRPSDSNSNGLVTCVGKVPQINGGYQDVKRYCGYRKELVGCSDEDTVK